MKVLPTVTFITERDVDMVICVDLPEHTGLVSSTRGGHRITQVIDSEY